MTFDTKKAQGKRQAFTVVEIYLDINDPALDSEFSLDPNSYGTPKTTEDARAYTGTDFRVYRYSDQQLFGVDHFPGLVKVTSNPPKIDPGKSIGFRATSKIQLIDFVSDDTFELPSEYAANRTTGSHFLKLFARNHLKNRRIRVGRGFDPFNYDDNNIRWEEYIIDDFTFPDDSGRVTINAVDRLILVESKKAKAPTVSKGVLNGAINATQTNLTFSTTVTDEYGAVSSTGYIAIEKEIMAYTVDSATTMTITRAQFGTEGASHNDQETIQKCIVYQDENIIDIIEDLITNYTGIPASYIPSSDWAALKAGDLANYNLTRVLYKPEDVKKILNDLIMLAGLSMYVDIVAAEIKIVTVPDFATPVISFNEDTHINQGTLKVKRQEKEQITRQTIFWDKANATESSDEKNFTKRFQVINGIVEAPADINNTSEPKALKSEWLTNSNEDNQLATNFCQRQINRYSQTPLEVTFEIDQRWIGSVSGGDMWLGSIFELTTNRIVDGGLNPVATTFQCTSIKEAGDKGYRVTGLSYVAAAPIDADLYINEDKTDYLLTDDLTTDEAREYTVVINSGVRICASSTANAAFKQGSFFAGATLKLVNLGQIYGHGGDGGNGADLVGYPTCTAGSTTGGSAGGDAIEITTDCIIDNGFGQIFGGGGGGSGRTIFACTSEISRAGTGGGGGQGCSGGAGGSGGIGTGGASNGFAGPSGSISGPNGNGGAFGEDGGSEGGGTGGAAGKAVNTNGNTLTITAGNNSEQIKGSVS